MPTLTAKVSGILTISRGENCTTATEAPQEYDIGLSSNGAAQNLSAGSNAAAVNSPGSFVALPFPTNLRARVFHLRCRTGGPLDVELTHATAGVVVHPGALLMLIEVTEAEQISAVRVRGESSDFEWSAVGKST